MRCLVTAGNTRERIDDVRDWGNIFTGKTGLAITEALAKVGKVDFVSSNWDHLNRFTDLSQGKKVEPHDFTSHADLMAVLERLLSHAKYDAIVMTAAVADYKPAGVYSITERTTLADGSEQWIVRNAQAGKVKSNYDQIAVTGTRTEKIVDLFRTRWNHQGLLVKFKLEVGIPKYELLKIAEASRKASGADYLVANTLDMVYGPEAGAYLISDGLPEFIPREALAKRLAALVQARAK